MEFLKLLAVGGKNHQSTFVLGSPRSSAGAFQLVGGYREAQHSSSVILKSRGRDSLGLHGDERVTSDTVLERKGRTDNRSNDGYSFERAIPLFPNRIGGALSSEGSGP